MPAKEEFGLYLILTDPVAGYAPCAEAAVECGVRYLQLRMKDCPPAEVIATAKNLRDITRGSATRLIINDDLSIAMEADADGIHLGQGDQSVAAARQQWSTDGKTFGLSTHSHAQERTARALGPDYIGVGPVFPTQTKKNADPALGPEETGHIIQQSPLTAVAIGGINPANLPGVLQAGTVNFCVISAVNQSSSPRGAIKELQEIWQKTRF
ncbi:MAG: thiamine phosphate synthase [Kiritimatiellales bacterium]|nr:thiamine phosphate synthase [Kiritimatiellales bacterium]